MTEFRAENSRMSWWTAGLKDAGKLLPDADILVGSIAIARAAILIAGNIRRYSRFQGIRLENWIR